MPIQATAIILCALLLGTPRSEALLPATVPMPPSLPLKPHLDVMDTATPWYRPIGPPPWTSRDKPTAAALASRVLAGAELDRRLRGSQMRRPVGVTFSHLIEGFHDNGTWSLIGTRAPLQGSWAVRGDRVCVDYNYGAPQEFCRRVLVGSAGDYFIQDAGGPAVKAIQPIHIGPPPTPVPMQR